jgi:hypothetical protein
LHLLVVMGPHPHDLYLAPLALGVTRGNDPLGQRLSELQFLHQHFSDRP